MCWKVMYLDYRLIKIFINDLFILEKIQIRSCDFQRAIAEILKKYSALLQIINWPSSCHIKKNNLNIGDWSRLSKQEKVLFIAIVNLKFVIARSFRYFFKIVTNKMTKLHEPELINQRPEMYYKKLLLKISQNSQGNTSARFSFLINLQASPYNFIKNRLWHTFFPVNFAKFLRTPVLQNISRLL